MVRNQTVIVRFFYIRVVSYSSHLSSQGDVFGLQGRGDPPTLQDHWCETLPVDLELFIDVLSSFYKVLYVTDHILLTVVFLI